MALLLFVAGLECASRSTASVKVRQPSEMMKEWLKDPIVHEISKKWSRKTLSQFRSEAQAELNGTVFESIRFAGGERIALVMCLTGQHELALAATRFQFASDSQQPPPNWETATLADMLINTHDGLAYEELLDPVGRRIAVAFCAYGRHAIDTIGKVFNLPP